MPDRRPPLNLTPHHPHRREALLPTMVCSNLNIYVYSLLLYHVIKQHLSFLLMIFVDFSSGGEALGTRGLSYSSTNSNASMLSTLTSITHPRIHDVLSNCKLNLSFVELSAMLDEPLDEIYRIVNHLEHWGLCKVITTITSNLVYIVSPSLAPSRGLSGLSKEGFKQNGGIKGINCFRKSGPQTLSHKSPSEANLQDAALADHTGDSGLEEDNSYLLLSRLFSSAFGLMKGINISEIDFFYASSAADADRKSVV